MGGLGDSDANTNAVTNARANADADAIERAIYERDFGNTDASSPPSPTPRGSLQRHVTIADAKPNAVTDAVTNARANADAIERTIPGRAFGVTYTTPWPP